MEVSQVIPAPLRREIVGIPGDVGQISSAWWFKEPWKPWNFLTFHEKLGISENPN